MTCWRFRRWHVFFAIARLAPSPSPSLKGGEQDAIHPQHPAPVYLVQANHPPPRATDVPEHPPLGRRRLIAPPAPEGVRRPAPVEQRRAVESQPVSRRSRPKPAAIGVITHAVPRFPLWISC
jgi:hypothetical protein